MAAFYRTSFTTVQTLTILGSVHQLGTRDLVYQVYDVQGNAIQESSLHVNPSTYTVTLAFEAPQSGSLVLLPAIAPAPSPGPGPGPSPTPPSVPAAPSGTGGLEPALRALLVETIQHSAYVGQDQYGKPSYAAAVTRPARIEYRVTTLTNAQGQERTSTTKAFCNGDFAISVRDRIQLEDGTAPAIQAVYSPRDLTGAVHHHELLL